MKFIKKLIIPATAVCVILMICATACAGASDRSVGELIYHETMEHKTETVDGATYIDGILIVNKKYSLPENFGGGIDEETQDAFLKMAKDAKKDGIELFIKSGYRSFATQGYLYERYRKADGEKADTYSARAGHSEHQSGLALDINKSDDSFASTKECKWLAENCAKYGFIIRYPEGKEKITGYKYEPWHIRYVGSIAEKITASGMCLEEYLGVE